MAQNRQPRETPAGQLLREQLRMLKRIRLCAEVWLLIGVLILLSTCGSCAIVVLAPSALLGMLGMVGLGQQ